MATSKETVDEKQEKINDPNEDATKTSYAGIKRSINGGKLKHLTKYLIKDMIIMLIKELQHDLIYIGPKFEGNTEGRYNFRIEVRRQNDCYKIKNIVKKLQKTPRWAGIKWYRECDIRYEEAQKKLVTPGGPDCSSGLEPTALYKWYNGNKYPTLHPGLFIKLDIFEVWDNNMVITPAPMHQQKHQHHQRNYDNANNTSIKPVPMHQRIYTSKPYPPFQKSVHHQRQRFSPMNEHDAIHSSHNPHHAMYGTHNPSQAQQSNVLSSNKNDYSAAQKKSSYTNIYDDSSQFQQDSDVDDYNVPSPKYQRPSSHNNDKQKMEPEEQNSWLDAAMYTEDDLKKISPYFLDAVAAFENIFRTSGETLNIAATPGPITEQDLAMDPVINASIRMMELTEEQNIVLHGKYFQEIVNTNFFNIGERTPGYLKEYKTVPAVRSFITKKKTWRRIQFVCEKIQQLSNELIQSTQ